MRKSEFLNLEREAFAEAKLKGFSDMEWKPPPPISPETIRGFRRTAEQLEDMWKNDKELQATARLLAKGQLRDTLGHFKD